jgi:two-component system NtrC family sensor kinase
MKTADFKLRERVKELNCLYAISRLAWETQRDVKKLAEELLTILPDAMQYPSLAEVKITIEGDSFTTKKYEHCLNFIDSSLTIKRKKFGSISIGYRKTKGSTEKTTFLKEEKNLLSTVARELSMIMEHQRSEEEKNKLEIQLQHAERLAFVGQLSAGIAHEINEPLGRILGFAQLIQKASNLSAQQQEDLERIVKASLYTREIIKKLMIFSSQIPSQRNEVNLNEIIENILYFIDLRFQGREITLVKELDPSLPKITGDEIQLSQVLVNLITNAVHAIHKGGKITIRTAKKPKSVSLCVIDNGIGMTPETKAQIFNPFFTTKPVGQGTGLGLSVVQGIIDAHNAKINVTTAPKKGSKFEITFSL